MRRAFGLKPTPIKVQATPRPENPKPEPLMGSPPFSPVSFVIERQGLSPQILLELRQACARIVQESGPSGAEYDEILNQPDPLEKYHSERAAYREMSGHRTQPAVRRDSKKEKPTFSRQQSNASHNASFTHKPTYAARDFQATSVNPNALLANNLNFEPLEPTHTTVSGHSNSRKPTTDPNDPLTLIRSNLDLRPKTSAAACIDYTGPTLSADNSSSTSRTATTYDPVRPSTGLTSLAMTPANEKRASAQLRISEQILQDGPAASQADATAKAWMAYELARRREEASAATAPPTLHKSTSRASLRRGHSESERPPSRAGSIAEGIREYIRPRASMDSFRTARSDTQLSRSGSRSSSSKGGNWWRGASAGLRRKGSWSSFRSAKPEDELEAERERAAGGGGREKGLDLNRSLPPLPGLDSYKEEKKKKMHISQLMSRTRDVKPPPPTAKSPLSPLNAAATNGSGGAGAGGADYFQLSKHPRPTMPAEKSSATIIDDNGLERSLSEVEEQSRQDDLRRAVQEKMLMGAISPPISPNMKALRRPVSHGNSMSPGPSLGRPDTAGRSQEREPRRPLVEGSGNGCAIEGVSVVKVEEEKVPELVAVVQKVSEGGRKRRGIRYRMSRFFGVGEKGLGRPVTAH